MRPSLLMSVEDAKGLAHRFVDPCFGVHVAESPVAIVMKEQGRSGTEHARNAIVATAQLVVAAMDVLADINFNETADEQIDARRYRRRTILRWSANQAPAKPAASVTSVNVPFPLFL
jgi:hypothetical protein